MLHIYHQAKLQHLPIQQQHHTAKTACVRAFYLPPLPDQAVLEGARDLFCGPGCEGAWVLRGSGGALRRALFKLERGECQACRLDCCALLRRLRCAALLV